MMLPAAVVAELGTVAVALSTGMLMDTCTKTIRLFTSCFDKLNKPCVPLSDLENLFIEEDLVVKVNKIHLLMKELGQARNLTPAIECSIIDINKAVSDINDIIMKCEEVRQHYHSMYLSSWRRLDCGDLIVKLRLGIKILNIRFADLERVIAISSHINSLK